MGCRYSVIHISLRNEFLRSELTLAFIISFDLSYLSIPFPSLFLSVSSIHFSTCFFRGEVGGAKLRRKREGGQLAPSTHTQVSSKKSILLLASV